MVLLTFFFPGALPMSIQSGTCRMINSQVTLYVHTKKLAHRQSVTTPHTPFAVRITNSKQSPIVLRQFWDSPGLAMIHSTTRASDGAPQENHGNMLQHASTDDTEGHSWPMSSCISLKGQALPAHTFSPTSQSSQFNCHNSIGGRPRGVRISS